MKIALLGTGRTGSKVVEVAEGQDGYEVTEFNLDNPPSVEALKRHDVAISFLPELCRYQGIPKSRPGRNDMATSWRFNASTDGGLSRFKLS